MQPIFRLWCSSTQRSFFRLWHSSTQRSHIMQPERILGIYSINCNRDLFNLRRFSSKDRQSPALLQYDFNLQHYYFNVVTRCCSLRVFSCSSTQTQNQPHRSLKINLNAVSKSTSPVHGIRVSTLYAVFNVTFNNKGSLRNRGGKKRSQHKEESVLGLGIACTQRISSGRWSNAYIACDSTGRLMEQSGNGLASRMKVWQAGVMACE